MVSPTSEFPPLVQGIARLANILKELNVRYGIIGGIAAALHGIPRATADVDVLFTIEKIRLPAFLDRLESEGFSFSKQEVLKELSKDGLSQVEFQKRRIDLLMPILPFFHKALERTLTTTFFGQPIRVVSPEDLILFKLIAFRPQDQQDIQAILAIKGKKGLQMDYLREWTKQLVRPTDKKLKQLEDWLRKLA